MARTSGRPPPRNPAADATEEALLVRLEGLIRKHAFAGESGHGEALHDIPVLTETVDDHDGHGDEHDAGGRTARSQYADDEHDRDHDHAGSSADVPWSALHAAVEQILEESQGAMLDHARLLMQEHLTALTEAFTRQVVAETRRTLLARLDLTLEGARQDSPSPPGAESEPNPGV